MYFSKHSYSTPLTMPLGLTYLAAVLEQAHYRVKIVDCPASDADHIYDTPNGRFKVQGLDERQFIEMIERETDIIGVSIMFSQQWTQVRDYINRIRRAFPHAKIIVGGEHPTAMSEYTLRDCPAIDYLVRGEGELTLLAELERRIIHITWQLPSGTRSESLDEEVIKGLARTGCQFLVYAPESGSQRTLDMIKKRVNLKNLQRSIAIAVKNGITTKVNFIIGFPCESRADIFKTLYFVWKLALMKVNV